MMLQLEFCKITFHEVRIYFMGKSFFTYDGVDEIHDIVENIRESVDYVNRTDGRLILFAEIPQQWKLSGKKLIHDCKTKWNLTFEMLSCAIKFREIFPRFAD